MTSGSCLAKWARYRYLNAANGKIQLQRSHGITGEPDGQFRRMVAQRSASWSEPTFGAVLDDATPGVAPHCDHKVSPVAALRRFLLGIVQPMSPLESTRANLVAGRFAEPNIPRHSSTFRAGRTTGTNRTDGTVVAIDSAGCGCHSCHPRNMSYTSAVDICGFPSARCFPWIPLTQLWLDVHLEVLPP